jgi:type II secretion system protein G
MKSTHKESNNTLIANRINHSECYKAKGNGFTLVELLATIVIVGILASIALPNYLNQLTRTRQSEAASSITQFQNAIVAFADENGIYPTSWKDLNEVAAIMTPSGATTQKDFKKMTLASVGCEKEGQNNCYTVEVIYEKEEALYTLTAMPVDSSRAKYNVIACLDLRLGTSDFKKGTQSGAASISNLICGDADDDK